MNILPAKPAKHVLFQHRLSPFLPVSQSLDFACTHFFKEYMMLPDIILLSALARVQLPSTQWELFLCYGSYAIPLYHPQEPLIQHAFPHLFLPYEYILCIGRKQSLPTFTQPYIAHSH